MTLPPLGTEQVLRAIVARNAAWTVERCGTAPVWLVHGDTTGPGGAGVKANPCLQDGVGNIDQHDAIKLALSMVDAVFLLVADVACGTEETVVCSVGTGFTRAAVAAHTMMGPDYPRGAHATIVAPIYRGPVAGVLPAQTCGLVVPRLDVPLPKPTADTIGGAGWQRWLDILSDRGVYNYDSLLELWSNPTMHQQGMRSWKYDCLTQGVAKALFGAGVVWTPPSNEQAVWFWAPSTSTGHVIGIIDKPLVSSNTLGAVTPQRIDMEALTRLERDIVEDDESWQALNDLKGWLSEVM